MTNTGLLASSGTIEGIKGLISEFYFTHVNCIELIFSGKNEWNISKNQNILLGVKVILKRKRYRFVIVN